MKNTSQKALIIIVAISLVFTMLCTYLWATVAAPVSTICSILVFIFAASTVICLNAAVKK